MADPRPKAAPAPEPAAPVDMALEPAPVAAPSVQRTGDGRIIMRTRDGLETVTDDQAETFVREGRGLPATESEVHEADLQREYGEGIGQELGTAAQAGADVATLGGYSAATRAIGGEESATRLREQYKRNPGSKTAGELATIGALTVATGGAGGAAGAVARATPAGLAMRAGLAAERALGGSSALSQIGAMSAAGTLEGGLFGLGQGVQDIALSEKDTDRTAEAALAHLGRTTGEGAALGLLGGGAAGAITQGGAALARRAGKALSRGEQGIAARLGRTADGPAADATATSAARSRVTAGSESAAESGASAGLSNRADLTIELEPGIDMRAPLKRLQDQASAAKRLETQREAFVPSVTKGFTEIDQAADQLAAEGRRIKPGDAKRALEQMPIGNYEATVARGSELLRGMADETQRFIDDPLLSAGVRGRGATSLSAVREAAKAVEGALPQGLKVKQGANYWKASAQNAAEAFGEWNYYKGIVGRAADNAKDSSARTALDSHYHAVQQYLEDETLWGGMSRLNQGANPGWSRWLTAKAGDSDLLSEALEKSRSDPFRQGRQGDSAKTEALFHALGDVRGGTRAQNAREWLDAQEQFARLISETYDLSPKGKQLAKRVKELRDELAQKINETVRTHADAREFRDMGGALNEMPLLSQAFKTVKVTASSLSNAALDLSSKARTGVDLATDVTADATARAAAQRADLAQRTGRLQGVKNAAGSVLSSIATASRALASSSSKAIKAALPAAAATAGGSTAQRYERAYRATRDFEDDPQAAVRRTWKAQGDLGRYAPRLAAAQAERQVALMTLLASKLPRHESLSIYGDNPDVPRATPSEQQEFLRYYKAANDPLSVIEDAADGRLTPEGVEVLKTGYPHLYNSLRTGVLNSLRSADKKPTYSKRLMLGQLLELPTDPALEPEMLAALQQSAAATAPPTADEGGALAPSQRKPPQTAGAQQTKTQSLQAGR